MSNFVLTSVTDPDVMACTEVPALGVYVLDLLSKAPLGSPGSIHLHTWDDNKDLLLKASNSLDPRFKIITEFQIPAPIPDMNMR